MAKLIEIDTGRIVEIPDEKVEAAVGTGRYKFQQGSLIPVYSPDGTFGTIDGVEAMQAFGSGFRFVSAAEQQKIALQKEFGGTQGELIAGGLGLLRGATLGLSDAVGVGMGADPRTIRGYQEANPSASLTGEIVGNVGGAFLPGALAAKGAMTSARATGMLPAALATRAGNLAAKPIVGKVAERGLLARSLPVTIASAVESTAYGIGNAISEEALGDAEFNAERLLAGMAKGGVTGAVTGAAIGFPMGFVSSILSKPTQKLLSEADKGTLAITQEETQLARIAMNKFNREIAVTPAEEAAFNKFASLSDTVKAQIDDPKTIAGKTYNNILEGVAFLTGADPGTTKAALQANKTGMDFRKAMKMTGAEKRAIQQEVKDLLDTEFKFLLKATKEIGPLKHKAVKPLLNDLNFEDVWYKSTDLFEELKDVIRVLKSDPLLYKGGTETREAIINFTAMENQLVKAIDKGKASEIFITLDNAKKSFDDLIKDAYSESKLFGMKRGRKNTILQLQKTTDKLRAHLTDPDVFGDAALVQKEINKVLSKSMERLTEMRKTFGGETKGKLEIDLGKVQSWMGIMGRSNLIRGGEKKTQTISDFTNAVDERQFKQIMRKYGGDAGEPLNAELIAEDIDKAYQNNVRRADSWENFLNLGEMLPDLVDDLGRLRPDVLAAVKAQSGESAAMKIKEAIEKESKLMREGMEAGFQAQAEGMEAGLRAQGQALATGIVRNSEGVKKAVKEIAEDSVGKMVKSAEELNKKILDLIELHNIPKMASDMAGDGIFSTIQNMPAYTAAVVEKLESMFSALNSKKKNAVASFLNKAKATRETIRKTAIIGIQQEGKLDSIRRGTSYGAIKKEMENKQKDRKEFSKQVNQLNKFVSNPQMLNDVLTSQMGPIIDAAPGTALAAQSSLSGTLLYLSSKVPVDPLSGKRYMEFFDVSPSISDADIRKFKRYLKAANDPYVLLEELEKGKVTKETLETVQTRYPRIYEDIRNEIAEQIIEKQFMLTYEQRNSLSRLFDIPLDPSNDPMIAMAIQSILRQGDSTEEKPRKAKVSNLNKNMQTQIGRITS